MTRRQNAILAACFVAGCLFAYIVVSTATPAASAEDAGILSDGN